MLTIILRNCWEKNKILIRIPHCLPHGKQLVLQILGARYTWLRSKANISGIKGVNLESVFRNNIDI
jgi:hypothetical protein